ncbi:MAG: dockerin type I domain-containing protein, partial [Bacteroidota bacterium]
TLYGPKELTIDPKGNIYLVDGNKIRKINNQTIITSFSPVAAGFGVIVTIKGYKFTGVTAVSFGGSSAVSFTVLNDSTITAKLGNGATGAVSITYSSGTATLPGFTYISTLISIAGKVINPSAAGYKSITGATISITGGSNVQSIAGEYKIYNLNNGSYTIKATKNNDINKTNGVTTLDIALVQSHVLGKSLLNSPYKIIAADVNGDGKVSTLDIVYMKRLILGIDTTFTKAVTGEKRLWTFVDSSLQFTDVTNPFPIKDSIKFIALNTSKTNQTFIGCKLGDVNWDWNPLIAKPARPVATKVQGELKLETDDNTID